MDVQMDYQLHKFKTGDYKEIKTKTFSIDMSFTILETQMFPGSDTKFQKKSFKVSW